MFENNCSELWIDTSTIFSRAGRTTIEYDELSRLVTSDTLRRRILKMDTKLSSKGQSSLFSLHRSCTDVLPVELPSSSIPHPLCSIELRNGTSFSPSFGKSILTRHSQVCVS